MENIEKPPVNRDSDKFMLRLPDGMRNRIAEASRISGRSMNTEIVSRLQESLEPQIPTLSWSDFVNVLQTEARKQGAKISITIE